MPTKKLILLLIIFLAFLTPATSYSGKLHKWVDKDGVVHVTDDPEKVPKEYVGTANESAPESKVDAALVKAEEIWKYIKDKKNKVAFVIAGLAIIMLLYRLLKYTKSKLNQKKKEERLSALEQSGIDNLDLGEFKAYIEALLIKKHFNLRTPEGTLDLGVDLIAEKDKTKYAVRIEHQSLAISRTVVNDLEREKHRYGCDRAMIISNNYFADDAVETAGLNGCELVDREKLGEWVLEFEKKRNS